MPFIRERAVRLHFHPDCLIDELAAAVIGRNDDRVFGLRGIVPGNRLDALFGIGMFGNTPLLSKHPDARRGFVFG